MCSGIGGLDLGLERAGIEVAGQVEIDPWCRKILAAHWPGVPQHDDVYTAADWWLSEERPRIDLVCGGVPCQPHSVAGLKLGTADPRWLWPAFAGVIERVAPPLVLIENVPRLRNSGLRDILISLADLGFDAWWNRVPAAALGAPHLRWRLILIAAHPDRIELRDEPGGRGGSHGASQAVAGFDGATWAVADPFRIAGQSWRPGNPGESARGRDADRGSISADAMADTSSARLAQLRGEPGEHVAQLAAAERDGDQWGAWPPEPGVGRVADGVANRVDRIRALGNGQVPRVAATAWRMLTT